MKRPIDRIPKTLNRENIDQAISEYLELLENIPLVMKPNSILGMITDLKRKRINSGPYPKVTLFESANRIMSDLTILHGIKALLNGAITEIDYEEYKVEYGHDNYHQNDITAYDKRTKLIGEAFNVAKSFFQSKKTGALKKMRRQVSGNDKLLLIYNSDAVVENYSPKRKPNEYHLKIDLDLCLNSLSR